jgi:putative ABC transport system substrate-binding protein
MVLAVFAAPLASLAQTKSAKPYRIGVLFPTTEKAAAVNNAAFTQALRERGYVEGQNVIIERRYAQAALDEIPALAAELVRLKVDVIVTATDPAIAAVKRETQTIPIVMAASADPVGTGFVATLARPGGNITGLSRMSPELMGKCLELLKEAVPSIARVAIVWNPEIRGGVLDYNETANAARRLRLHLQSVELGRAEDFDRAFSAITKENASALIVPAGNPVLFANRGRIAGFALKNRLPSMYSLAEFTDAGGLMSYGTNTPGLWRHATTFVDKILKGAKPADLPVEQPTQFQLVVNLKTAKALGITLPQTILVRADRVIE